MAWPTRHLTRIYTRASIRRDQNATWPNIQMILGATKVARYQISSDQHARDQRPWHRKSTSVFSSSTFKMLKRVCQTVKSDLSSTTKCERNYKSHISKFGHTSSSSQTWPFVQQMGILITREWFIEQKLMLSSNFRCDQIHNCHWNDLGHTL